MHPYRKVVVKSPNEVGELRVCTISFAKKFNLPNWLLYFDHAYVRENMDFHVRVCLVDTFEIASYFSYNLLWLFGRHFEIVSYFSYNLLWTVIVGFCWEFIFVVNFCINLYFQTLCILTNLADGDEAKDYIMGNEDVLKKLTTYMVRMFISQVGFDAKCYTVSLLWI